MVPSRSRKTAGRRDAASARSHLRRTQPGAGRGFDGFGPHAGHATVVRRTAPQKAWAAIRLFLHHGASGSDRSGAMRIGRTKDGDNRQAHGSSDVHCARIVADEQVAAREERRESGDCGFAHQTNRRASYFCSDRFGNPLLRCGAEKNYVCVRVKAEAVYEISEALRGPAFRGAVRGPGTYCDSHRIRPSAS